MDYSTFKSLQFVLFFGSAFAFCFWQLASIRRMRRERVRSSDPGARVERQRASERR